MERLWTRFYKLLRKEGVSKYPAPKHEHEVLTIVNIKLSTLDGYISEDFGFNVTPYFNRMIEVYSNSLDAMDDTAQAFDVGNKMSSIAHEMYKDYLQYRDNPTFSQKIVKNLLAQIEYQEDPDNRFITDVKFIPKNFSEQVYDVYITSNCDGWAEDEDKLIGQTMKPDKNLFIGHSETFAASQCNNIDMFVELCNMVDKVEPTYIAEDGLKYFANESSELIDFVCNEACTHFITMRGGCNWYKINMVRSRGIDISAGEQDSFGWLTGRIETRDGNIFYYG